MPQDKLTKLEFLNRLYVSLSSAGSLKEILKTLSDIVQENLESDYVDFMLVDESEPHDYIIYSIPKGGVITEEPKYRYPTILGTTKKSIETRKTIVLEDINTDPDYKVWRKEVKSELCVPIFSKRKAIGCINLEFKNKQVFDQETVTLLEIIGKTVGAIIKNARLHGEVEQSEKKFRQLVEHMNEGLWMGDERHKTVYVNPRFAEMAGLSYEECLKRDCYGFYDEEGKKRIKEHHKLRPQGLSSQYEITMLDSNGKRIPLLCSGTPIPGGTVGIFTNLSSLKEKEKTIVELSKSEKMLAYVTDNSIDAIVSIDRNLIIQSWNKGAEKMFGFSKEEALNQNVRMLIPPEKLKQGELEQIVKMTLEKGFVRNFETIRLSKNAKELQVSMSVTKLTDTSDRFIGFGMIYRDISYQKKAERELQSRFESMQNAYLELGRQRRQLDYLLETLNIAIGDEQFPNIENYIVNAAVMLTKADGATLRIFNKNDNMLNLKALSGVQATWWGKSKIPFENTIAEKAYKSRRPLFINDLQNNPIYSSPKLATDHGFIAALCIPLYVKNQYLGNLTLYSSEKNKLILTDDSFITNFGKQASLALLTNLKKEQTD